MMKTSSLAAAVYLSAMLLAGGCRSGTPVPDAPAFRSGSVNPVSGGIPAGYNMSPPYPNPFASAASIEIAIPVDSPVLLVVQNPLGDVITTLIARTLAPGNYRVTWDATEGGTRDPKPGFYFITLHAPGFTGSRIVKFEP